MLQKEKSTTRSSRSDTSRSKPPTQAQGLKTPVQFVKGIGPKLGSVFQSRGIETIYDLLFFFPRAYEDRSRITPVRECEEGLRHTVRVRISSSRRVPLRRQRRTMLEARAEDQSGESIRFKWFHAPRSIESQIQAGNWVIATGMIKSFLGNKEMIHPELTFDSKDGSSKSARSFSSQSQNYNTGRIVPIYPELEGIPTRTFRKVLWNALQAYQRMIHEDLPHWLIEKHQLPSLKDALKQIHFPDQAVESFLEFDSPYHHRVIYEEFLKFELLVLLQRLNLRKSKAPKIPLGPAAQTIESFKAKLPFQLTDAQEQAVDSILKEISEPRPMNRLIQGDVGSGKTVVCFLIAVSILAQGHQVCLMAPTEILAEQHYQNALKLLHPEVTVELLTGKTTKKNQERIIGKLKAGEKVLLIGTHALIENPVQFHSLALVMIDEQHRFGVNQRKKLREKGGSLTPHTLVLTATPIPRTLSLTVYGDLSVTSIRELPPGRKPVQSQFANTKRAIREVYQKVAQEIQRGRQAYFIFPLVEESEAEGFTELKAAVDQANRLQEEVFPEFKVGLMHGQLKPDEKSKVMRQFKASETQILVSTTVVEVGVDVPNATVMVIENAERFGLSQLHQLRGRVGRGEHQSYCFFIGAERLSEVALERLKIMEKTSNGFDIAEADLKIRGPGEFLGTRQSGSLPFKVADIIRDQNWLLKARDDATDILKNDPTFERISHLPLRNYFQNDGKEKLHQLMTS